MIDSIKRLPPIPGLTEIQPTQRTVEPNTGGAVRKQSFDELLNQNINQSAPLNFSAHAQSRLLSRNIQLNGQQMARLQSGVTQAAQKGAKDSLVVMDNLAFIVSVSNRTVVTAVDGAAQNGNVFTQIDSAVIV